MPVSAGIYNALAQPVRSVADYAADYDQADLRKQGIQRNALMMQEAQAAMADRERTRGEGETLRNALAALGAGATPEQRIGAMEGTGLPQGFSQADALRKALIEQRKGNATAAKDEAATEADRYKLTRTKLEHGVQWLQVAQNPQQAQQMYADGVRKGYWSMQDAQQQAQTIPQDPAQFTQWKQTQLAQILDAAKLLPTVQTRNTGGSTDTLAVNPLTGVPTVTGSVRNTQSPESVAQTGLGYAKLAEDKRQFGITDARAVAKEAAPAKPLPPGALKMQQESLDAIGISSSINADLGGIAKQIDGGKLSFGPVENLVNAGRNMAGVSSENSRNFASFKSTLERLRNESLRLNAGVQTDGDAQRAWNELFQNINDTDLVKQRLGEIQNINKRGAELHRLRVDSIRSNYNASPLDVDPYKAQPAAVGATPGPAGKPGKTVKRTGTSNGRKVVEYTDGSIEYAD